MIGISRIRLVSAAVVALTLAVAPMAHALPAERSTVQRAESGWFETALRWLEEAVGPRRPAGRQGRSVAPAGTTKEGSMTTNGGSCIDPMGNTKPWCQS